MIRIAKNKTLVLLLILFSQLIIACAAKEEVASNLSIGQAIEVLLSLSHSGVSAQRLKTGTGKNEKFSIVVPADDYLKAIEILHEFNLPRKDTETLESLTAQEGFTPNIKQISELKLDRALAVEAERLILALNGIVDARVVIRSNLVSSENFLGATSPERDANRPKATIVLKFNTSNENLPVEIEQKIKNIISQIVPTISADDILLTALRVNLDGEVRFGALTTSDGKSEILPLAQVDLLPIVVPVSHKNQVRAFLVILMGIFVFCGVFIGWWLGLIFKRKHVPSKGLKTAILEANFLGQQVLPPAGGPTATKTNEGSKE